MADTAQRENNNRGTQVRRRRSMTFDMIGGFLDFLFLLLLAWAFSIIAEWIGMFFFWPEQGAMHSAQMLVTELGYLNRDFTRGVGSLTPEEMAIWLSSSLYFWVFEWTHIVDLIAWAITPPADAGAFRLGLATVTGTVNEYLSAMINVSQVFGVRLAVALLATPIFILVGVAALTDGLVERELRRFGGGNESAFVYHKVKPWLRPAVVGAWFIYLGLPVSVHPNMIFVPAALMYGIAVYLTASYFKKYL